MNLRSLVERLAARLPAPRVIYDRTGKSPYLSRYYLIGKEPVVTLTGNPKSDALTREPFQLYLHKFHRSDEDGALHNRPWRWSLSFVLVGGYSEERRHGERVFTRLVRPLSFNFIAHDDFHRVDLREDDAWTLFLVGPKISSWGFWDRLTGAFTPWREHITKIRGSRWEES